MGCLFLFFEKGQVGTKYIAFGRKASKSLWENDWKKLGNFFRLKNCKSHTLITLIRVFFDL